MRILISGGPGSGCTSTAKCVGVDLGIPVLDSDVFFHKPSDPPFQAQYTPEERRPLMAAALESGPDWILSGSVSTWDVDLPPVHLGVFLDTPKGERLRRLEVRERERFGSRVEVGGDLHTENKDFMEWAAGYEDRMGRGRNRTTDRAFLSEKCDNVIEISHSLGFDEITSQICRVVAELKITARP